MGAHQTGSTYVQGGQYVTGTVGQTYTTTTVAQPAEKVVYTTNTVSGPQYTSTYETVPSNVVYTNSPQYTTTYETVPVGANTVYTTGPQYATTYETVPTNYVVNESGSRVGQQYV